MELPAVRKYNFRKTVTSEEEYTGQKAEKQSLALSVSFVSQRGLKDIWKNSFLFLLRGDSQLLGVLYLKLYVCLYYYN